LPGKYAEYADLIHDSGQYMLDLIGDVLDLSKVEAGKYTLIPDTFDVADVVRSSVKMIRPSADSAEVLIDIKVSEDDPLLLTADRKATRQILLNLLSNAVKFSPKGGLIRVTAEDVDGVVCLSVIDEGPGMSADEIARIGQPYAQGNSGKSSDARGTGLGLSLVQTLAELHGGRLNIQSHTGDGTVARVYLPALPVTS
jgi:cell cycle sensor histidine kinase DivJ